MPGMTDAIEAGVRVLAPPEAVYAIWADVPHWPEWDPDTRQAFLDGPLAVGAALHCFPSGEAHELGGVDLAGDLQGPQAVGIDQQGEALATAAAARGVQVFDPAVTYPLHAR